MGLCAIARERFPVVAKPTSLVTQRFVSRFLSRFWRARGMLTEAPAPPAPVDTRARQSSAWRAQLRRIGVYHGRFCGVKKIRIYIQRSYEQAIRRFAGNWVLSLRAAILISPYQRHPCHG